MFRKLASIPKEYESIGGGFYRKAHEVWRLEASDDEKKPFKLIRVKSEKKFLPEAGLQKQAGMRKTASAERRGRVFRAGSLVEVTVRTDDGDKAEVEHEDGVIEILPSAMIHDAEPSIETMQMLPEDGEANTDVHSVVPGAGKVNHSVASEDMEHEGQILPSLALGLGMMGPASTGIENTNHEVYNPDNQKTYQQGDKEDPKFKKQKEELNRTSESLKKKYVSMQKSNPTAWEMFKKGAKAYQEYVNGGDSSLLEKGRSDVQKPGGRELDKAFNDGVKYMKSITEAAKL